MAGLVGVGVAGGSDGVGDGPGCPWGSSGVAVGDAGDGSAVDDGEGDGSVKSNGMGDGSGVSIPFSDPFVGAVSDPPAS
jgi:hypothetical protein